MKRDGDTHEPSTRPFKTCEASTLIQYFYFLLHKIYRSYISSDVGVFILTHISRNMEREKCVEYVTEKCVRVLGHE
jgi:hypothetical protein